MSFNIPPACISDQNRSYAASRPLVFGLSSPGLAAESDPPPFRNQPQLNRSHRNLATDEISRRSNKNHEETDAICSDYSATAKSMSGV